MIKRPPPAGIRRLNVTSRKNRGHHSPGKRSVHASCRPAGDRSSTFWPDSDAWIVTDRHLANNCLGNAAGLCHLNGAGNAFGLGDHHRLTHCARNTVRNLSGSCFLHIGAGRVRDLLHDSLADPAAGRVRNLLGDGFADIGASCVRNLLRSALTHVAAGRVRNTSSPGFAHIGAGGVGNLLRHADRNPAADGVRNAAVLHFRHHSGADLLGHDRLWNPDSLGDGTRRALNFFDADTSGLVDRAATGFIHNKLARLLNAAIDHWSGNTFSDSLPLATLNWNTGRCGHGTQHSLIDIAIAGLGFCTISRAGDGLVTGLIDRTTNGVAFITIAGLIDRTGHGVIHGPVAGLVDRLTNGVIDCAIASLVDRLAYGRADILVAGLIDRTADRVALITIAGIVNSSRAAHRHLIDAGVHHSVAFCVLLSTPDRFFHSLVALPAMCPGNGIVASRFTTGGGTIAVLSESAKQASLCLLDSHQRHHCRQQGNPIEVFHDCVLFHQSSDA